MPEFDHRAYAESQLAGARNFFRSDVEALDEAAIINSPGGKARPPIDFIYEIVLINRRIASRLRGEQVAPMDRHDEWIVAPAEFRTKATAMAEFDASMQEVIDALGTDVLRPIQMPDKQTTAFELALFCGLHAMYHDAQLNYVQCLGGDSAMHWG